MKKIITALLTIAAIAAVSLPQNDANAQYLTQRCCTFAGACNTGVLAPAGTPCWCATPAGPVGGNAC